jgi:hypothetical protein
MTESSIHRAKDPWDRRQEESARAYAAFECYLHMEPLERTIVGAYRLHTDNPDALSPSDHFKGLAKRHDWKERARAHDDAKARARTEAELKSIKEHAAEVAYQKERAHTQVTDLTNSAYEKAKAIYERELTRENYSMGHAVQMTKIVLECYRMLVELEKVTAHRAEHEWTEEDDLAILKVMEEVEAMEEPDLEELDPTTRFFEEQRRRELEEKDAGSEEPGDAST